MKIVERVLVSLLCGLLAAAVLACSTTSEPESDAVIVPPDKTDNFMSETAQEYMLEGTTTVTIERILEGEPEELRLARVRELIPLKQIVIGWFLLQYVKPHDSHGESDYGGFDCLTKNGSYEDLDIRDTGDGLTYSFRFRQEIAGTLDLLEKLPDTWLDDDGHTHFILKVGKITNSEMEQLEVNDEWYRRSPWGDFDPSKVSADRIEDQELTIWPEPRSTDAWIDYNALFADGEVTIGIHFGWDYHAEYHLKHSEDVYDWLVARGFDSPVDAYGDYTRSSGPLTRTIDANGKDVLAKVWLYWGKPGTDCDPDTDAGGRVLEQDMRDSFKNKEVIVFSGHSGPFYGFALANWRVTEEGDLDDSEIPGLDMPSGVYQVVMAEGCETYGMGQGFWDNPNKSDRSKVDVITTTSFSNASTPAAVTDFLTAMVGADSSSNVHKPQTFRQLLVDLDRNSYWFSTMYGVHGIDDNPHLHPYADPAVFCQSCRYDSECGVGHRCAKLNEEEKACFAECTADDGCPDGWKCMDVAVGYTMESKACVPVNLTCVQEPPEIEVPELMINELLADPPSDLAGDANGDGVRDASQDEFVEIYNHGQSLVDLEGWQIADATGTRFVFPHGATLMSGEAVVVFGGGEPAGDFGGSIAHATASMLGLNNSGDTVLLVAPDKTVVDRVDFGREGGQDRSLVRERDGDPTAAWVPHPGEPFSPGKRQDGSAF
ncbi:MAG: lamin tail domain-containing protein [Deltaproteobacteria bacterium]|nr:lamin tail domain-containing protein [Deltaproteobacteria bacterium]